jgi:two-component system sensor histidine kinase KdpD
VRNVLATNATYRRAALGGAVALGGQVALVFIMLPLRTHLSIATPALVFLVPVTFGVALGGFAPGVASAFVGFLLYDIFFIPPYGTLTVQVGSDWVALVVYVVVVLVVARLVSNMQAARDEARRRQADADRLFDLSQALIGDMSDDQLFEHIVTTVQTTFTPRWTALLLPGDTKVEQSELTVAAFAGEALTAEDLTSLTSSGAQPRSLGLAGGGKPGRIAVALVASGRPVGMLVLHEVQLARQDRALLGTFANQAALTVERSRLQEQALRNRLLEEIDRWRGAMMGAVSHDLRTPLASIKAAVSGLRADGGRMQEADRAELLELIELQSDRLARLVTNLLDMTRVESGALAVRPSPVQADELVEEAVSAVSGLVPRRRIRVDAPTDLPLLAVDPVLIGQVLANLLENAARLSPEDSPICVSLQNAQDAGTHFVQIAVTDDGPGIAEDERERVFEMFSQNSGGGRAGLGLAIAKSFVEAHGGTIWVDPAVTQGARVIFTVPSEITGSRDG